MAQVTVEPRVSPGRRQNNAEGALVASEVFRQSISKEICEILATLEKVRSEDRTLWQGGNYD